jgi:hypothetical protein
MVLNNNMDDDKHNFTITQEERITLSELYPKGKSGDIGKLAVEITKLYFVQQNPNTIFVKVKGVDLSTSINGLIVNYEIKGTEGSDPWKGLVVSSKNCHDLLVRGMTLIRITNIRSINMTLYFFKYNKDFELRTELRWTVIRKKNNQQNVPHILST